MPWSQAAQPKLIGAKECFVNTISTRFEGPNYRVSRLLSAGAYGLQLANGLGFSRDHYASGRSPSINLYDPNAYNAWTLRQAGESLEEYDQRKKGRWLLTFNKALDHSQRTGGKLIQPIQLDHRQGPYSDMQKAEASMAKRLGVPVVEFKFHSHEASHMKPDGTYESRADETALQQRLELFIKEHCVDPRIL